MREGPIVKKSIDFSVLIFKYSNHLKSKRQFVISHQLLKSGTSIGANVFEAQYPESRLDFIHKMKVALKEANETLYWLTLCKKLIAILSSIIITSKKNFNSNTNKQ